VDAPVKVACVQAEPVILDREATVDKLVGLAAEAAGEGASLLVFPEAFIPVYPSSTWAKALAGWGDERAKDAFARLAAEAVAVPGEAADRIGEAAREHGVWIVTGVTEVDPERPGTLYNTLLYHGPDGRLALRHRKLVPTNHERLVWGQGDGGGLRAIPTGLGRIGGLICWEAGHAAFWLELAENWGLRKIRPRPMVSTWLQPRPPHRQTGRHRANGPPPDKEAKLHVKRTVHGCRADARLARIAASGCTRRDEGEGADQRLGGHQDGPLGLRPLPHRGRLRAHGRADPRRGYGLGQRVRLRRPDRADVMTEQTKTARIAGLPEIFRLAVEKKLLLKHRSEKTVVNALSHLVPFGVWLASAGLAAEAVTGDDLDRYFSQHTGAPRTIKEARKRIKWAYDYAIKRGDLGVTTDPFLLSEFEPPAPPDERPKTIPVEELRKMARRCRSENGKTLFLFLTYTGMRVDEIRRLRWADIDWDERSVTFVGKGNKSRTVPLHPLIFERLGQVRPRTSEDGAILTGSTRLSHREVAGEPYQALDKLKREFTDEPFHSFRRTVATSLGRNKVEERLIFRIMGWQRKTIFDMYYDAVDVNDLHAAISNLYADDPVGGIVEAGAAPAASVAA
jgi:integrase